MSRPFTSRSFSAPAPFTRVNGKIRAREVRVIDGEQKNLGVLSLGQAIALAVGMAKTGDIVLIAGKGHEAVQILKGGAVAFDDREAARKALRALHSKR